MGRLHIAESQSLMAYGCTYQSKSFGTTDLDHKGIFYLEVLKTAPRLHRAAHALNGSNYLHAVPADAYYS